MLVFLLTFTIDFSQIKTFCRKVDWEIKRIAAFYNPEFYAKQGMRLPTYDILRIISCSELTDDYLAIPRGCEDDVINILKHYNVEYIIDDKTNHRIKSKVTIIYRKCYRVLWEIIPLFRWSLEAYSELLHGVLHEQRVSFE